MERKIVFSHRLKNPINLEIAPCVEDEHGVESFATKIEAEDYAEQVGSKVFWSIYVGVSERHAIANCDSYEDALEHAATLFGQPTADAIASA